MTNLFPEISTERFLLRKIESGDQATIFEGLSNPRVIEYYGVSYNTFEATRSQMDFYNFLLADGSGIWWGICRKSESGNLVGACGFNNFDPLHQHIEIGYWLLPHEQGGGIMAECLPFIIQHAFRVMKVHRITAVVEVGNESSARLLKKMGFEYEGTLRSSELKNGQFISLQYFALLNKQA